MINYQFALVEGGNKNSSFDTLGFKTSNHPIQNNELSIKEEDTINIVKNIFLLSVSHSPSKFRSSEQHFFFTLRFTFAL